MGWIPYNKIIKKDTKHEFSKLWNDLKANYTLEVLNNYFYFDSSYNFTSKKEFEIKISSNINCTSTLLNKLKVRGDIQILQYAAKVKFKITGGNRGSGSLKYDGDTTQNPSNNEQELGTIYAIEHPKCTIEDINKSVKYIFDESWGYHFTECKSIRDYKINYNNILRNNSTIIHDATSKDAKAIFDAFKGLGYKDSKDNWNPADMWILNKPFNEILRELKTANSIEHFNHKIAQMFYSADLVGVSLKKISKGSKAELEIVDPTKRKPIDIKLSQIDYTKGNTNFIIKCTSGFNVRAGYKAASGSNKVYFEGRMSGTNVQLGAISKVQMNEIFKDELNINFSDMENDPKIDRYKLLEDTIKFIEKINSTRKDFMVEMYYMAMKQSTQSSVYLKLH